MNSSTFGNVRRLTGLALLSSLVIVLTVLGSFIRFGPFTITLALVPIIVGAAIYGEFYGALLGGLMGIIVIINGMMSGDIGTVTLWSIDPFWLIVVCILKSGLAGFLAGVVYSALKERNHLVAVILAGIACPLTNTGVFIISLLTVFKAALYSWSGNNDVLTYVIFILTGWNFIVELSVNLVLATGISSIIKYGSKGVSK